MTVYAETLAMLAHEAYRAGQHDQAEVALRFAAAAGGQTAHATYFIGHLCYLTGRLGEAEAYLTSAISLDPGNGHAHNDLGETLRALGRHQEAIGPLERAVALAPGLAHAYGNLATALISAGRSEEALRWAQESLWRSTDKATAHRDLGSVFARLGRFREALLQYDLSLTVQPDDPRTRYFAGLIRLTLGDLPAAWADHEVRLSLPAGSLPRRQDPRPPWRGDEPVNGRTILLHAEQGFGDTLQFVRYARLVADQGASVVLEVQPGLRRLLADMDGITAVLEQGEATPPHDLHCPLMSLPAVFRTDLHTIPGPHPYLHARLDRLARWRDRLGSDRRPRVGLAWSGRAGHANDGNRSLAMGVMGPLLARTDITWHVVQREIRESDRAILRHCATVTDHSEDLTDFAETAALLSALDLVISVDTVTAHLAGALCRPAWVLLPHVPDWRWMTDRADTPWYPTLRLIRQPAIGDWATVIRAVHDRLDEWMERRA